MNKKEKLDYIYSDIQSVKDVFQEKYEKHLENVDYYAGRQWTEDEEEMHRLQFRYPYVFNEIQHKIDNLVGMQMSTRLDVTAVGREYGDQRAADFLSFLIKWAEQVNNIERTETEVFLDATLGGAGASVIYWKEEDVLYGYPSVDKVPINELYWDGNSKKSDLSDARWMARVMLVARDDAMEMYPEYKDKIKGLPGATETAGVMGRINREQSKREEDMHRLGYPNENDSRDILEVVEYYESCREDVYVVIDDIHNEKYEFDDSRNAEEFGNGLIKQYIEDDFEVRNEDSSLKIRMECVSVPSIEQSIILGDELLYTEKIDIPFFPYDVNFGYFADGDYWGFTDNLISPQIAVNRFFSMWDYAVGASTKSPVTVMESLLPRGMEIEDVRRELKNVSPVMPVLNHSAIDVKANVPVKPELFQGITFGISRMNDYAGGKNVLGLQENAAESGKAVLARAEQGGLARLPLFDNLRQWRRMITYKMVWWMKNYMEPQQQLRVIGTDKDVRYVDVDDGVLDTIREMKYDIVVDEVSRSESMRERKFEQLTKLFSTIPQLPPEIATEFLLEYSDIPETMKKEIMQRLDHYKEYTMKKAQLKEQEEMEKSVMDSLKRKALKQAAEREEEFDEKASELKTRQKEINKEMQGVQKEREKLQEENAKMELEQEINRANTRPEIQRLRQRSIIDKLM